MSALEIKEKQIDALVITKAVASQQLLLRELVGGALFDLNQGGDLAVGIDNGRLVVRKLKGETLSETLKNLTKEQKQEKISKLAKLLAATKKSHGDEAAFLVAEVDQLLGFISFVDKNLRFLEQTKLISSADKRLLTYDLLGLRKTEEKELTLVHGDLGLNNIVCVEDRLVLIDFEHVVQGVIEMDLAPGLFWKDKNSLPIDDLVKRLSDEGVVVSDFRLRASLSLYLVNQLRLAEEVKDGKKIKLLLKMAKLRQIINQEKSL